MPLPAPRPVRALLLPAAIAVTVALWGTAFVAIRSTLPAVGYANLASGRLLLAALTLAVLAPRLGVRRPARRQLPLLAVLGATGYTGYQLLLSAGEETVPAGTSALLFGGAPVLAAVLARPVLGERMSGRSVAGLCVALAGVGLVAASQGGLGGGAGTPLVLGAVVLYAFWVVLQKRALANLSAIDVTAWATWFGALFALPFATGVPQVATTASVATLGAILLLGVVITTVPFLLWTWALQRIDASRAAPCLLLISPTALVIAWLWLGESPALVALGGGVLTVVGVIGVQRGARRPGGHRAQRAGVRPTRAVALST